MAGVREADLSGVGIEHQVDQRRHVRHRKLCGELVDTPHHLHR
jgi:hypothetical protein